MRTWAEGAFRSQYTSILSRATWQGRLSVEWSSMAKLSGPCTLFAILCFAAFALGQDAPKPAPDRSAESELRQVFTAAGRLRHLEATLARSSRFLMDDPMSYDGVTDLSYSSPNRFNVYYSEMWGGGFRAVSDGATLLVDPLDGVSPASLSKAPENLFSADPSLAAKGGVSSPFFYFLAGEPGFELIVKKDGFIRRVRSRGLEDGIEFQSNGFGKVTVYYRYSDPRMLLRSIEYDNRDVYGEVPADAPGELEDFFSGVLIRHEIEYRSLNRPIEPKRFSTEPPRNVRVDDKRKLHSSVR